MELGYCHAFHEEVFPARGPRLLATRGRKAKPALADMRRLQLKAAAAQHWYAWPSVFHALGLQSPRAAPVPGFGGGGRVAVRLPSAAA